jgi:hypothetical protein
MERQVEWGGSPQDVTIRCFGEASFSNTAAFVRELLEDERYRPGLKILIDYTELQTIEYSSGELRGMIDRVIAMEEKMQSGYCAIVVPTPVVYGVMRIWEAEIESATKARLRLFRGREDAIAWLRDPDAGGAGSAV